MFFDWLYSILLSLVTVLRYPDYFPVLLRAVEVLSDRPTVIKCIFQVVIVVVANDSSLWLNLSLTKEGGFHLTYLLSKEYCCSEKLANSSPYMVIRFFSSIHF